MPAAGAGGPGAGGVPGGAAGGRFRESAAEEKKRPTAVTILGWLLIAVSALALLSSCGCFAVCLLISERAPGRFTEGDFYRAR